LYGVRMGVFHVVFHVTVAIISIYNLSYYFPL
jgi:hypothetical protein